MFCTPVLFSSKFKILLQQQHFFDSCEIIDAQTIKIDSGCDIAAVPDNFMLSGIEMIINQGCYFLAQDVKYIKTNMRCIRQIK